MATYNQLVYNILNIARGGLSSDDDRLNTRQIGFWINSYRAQKVWEEVRGGGQIDPQLVQDLGCLELSSVDKGDCPSVLWGCKVKRVAIPKLVDLPNNRALVHVGLIDKQTPIILSSADIIHHRSQQRFTGGMIKAYFIGEFLYVTDPDIKYINVRGVFDDPLSIEYTGQDNVIHCLKKTEPYPIPAHFIPDITERIMRKELQMTITTVNDEVNDSRENDAKTA